MDVPGRDGVEQFAEHGLEKPARLGKRGQQVREDAPVGGHPERPAGVRAELGDGREQGRCVTRDVDLGHDSHHPLRRVRRKLGQVGERVITAVRRFVVHGGLLPAEADPRPRPVRADLVQRGMAAALDPPALIVGEMQVEPVQLDRREAVDERQQLALGEEVPGHVQVAAAPG